MPIYTFHSYEYPLVLRSLRNSASLTKFFAFPRQSHSPSVCTLSPVLSHVLFSVHFFRSFPQRVAFSEIIGSCLPAVHCFQKLLCKSSKSKCIILVKLCLAWWYLPGLRMQNFRKKCWKFSMVNDIELWELLGSFNMYLRSFECYFYICISIS